MKGNADYLFYCEHTTHLHCYAKTHHAYDDTFYKHKKCLECDRRLNPTYKTSITKLSKKYKANAWFIRSIGMYRSTIPDEERAMMQTLKYSHCVHCNFWVEKEYKDDCHHGTCPVCHLDIYMFNN
jgi:hypothetical protein